MNTALGPGSAGSQGTRPGPICHSGASTPLWADVPLVVSFSSCSWELWVWKTDFSVEQFQETLNANLCLSKGLFFFEKMEHVVLRHDSSGVGRWGAKMREWGTHGTPGFRKGSCKINALAGTPLGFERWAREGGQRKERSFLHPPNVHQGPAACHVLFLPLGMQ